MYLLDHFHSLRRLPDVPKARHHGSFLLRTKSSPTKLSSLILRIRVLHQGFQNTWQHAKYLRYTTYPPDEKEVPLLVCLLVATRLQLALPNIPSGVRATSLQLENVFVTFYELPSLRRSSPITRRSSKHLTHTKYFLKAVNTCMLVHTAAVSGVPLRSPYALKHLPRRQSRTVTRRVSQPWAYDSPTSRRYPWETGNRPTGPPSYPSFAINS